MAMAKPQDSDPPPGAAELAEQHPRRRPRRKTVATLGIMALGGVLAVGFQATAGTSNAASSTSTSIQSESDPEEDQAEDLVKEGRQTFRFDTFGDQDFWGGTLHLNPAIAGSANAGVGPGVSPKTALGVGLKVDVDALPTSIKDALAAHQVDLDDPKVTLALLKLNSVVGVKGFFDSAGSLKSVGITCALCHSTVDNSFAPGIGKRLDGWANRDLNVGAIVALSPALPEELKAEFRTWGPGKYDPRHHAFDGVNLLPLNSPSLPIVIPSIYGLKGVGFETFTGDGPISYWNAYVGVGQMGGHGRFNDPRIGLFINQTPDRVTPKLPALLEYQLSLRTPMPPSRSIDRDAARRGRRVFNAEGRC